MKSAEDVLVMSGRVWKSKDCEETKKEGRTGGQKKVGFQKTNVCPPQTVRTVGRPQRDDL